MASLASLGAAAASFASAVTWSQQSCPGLGWGLLAAGLLAVCCCLIGCIAGFSLQQLLRSGILGQAVAALVQAHLQAARRPEPVQERGLVPRPRYLPRN